jgi:hypothetical protein
MKAKRQTLINLSYGVKEASQTDPIKLSEDAVLRDTTHSTKLLK